MERFNWLIENQVVMKILISPVVGILSTAFKYAFEKWHYLQGESDKPPRFRSFIAFFFVATIVVATALAVVDAFGYEIDYIISILLLWIGICADYIYVLLETATKKIAKFKIDKASEKAK